MKKLKILYLEDSAYDAEMTLRSIKKLGIETEVKIVDNKEDFSDALQHYQPDLILSDHSLYQFNSLEALRIFKESNLNVPFILVTGTVSEEFAVTVLKEGADDYLLKDNLTRLPNAILNSLEKYRLDSERQQYINHIIANEAIMREAEGIAHFGSWEIDMVTKTTRCSEALYRIYGYEPGEIKANYKTFIDHLYPDDLANVIGDIENSFRHLSAYNGEFRIVDKNKKVKYVSCKVLMKRNAEGECQTVVGFMQDITERKEVEGQFLQTVTELAKLEKELIEQKLNKQKLITETTIQAQESEREELSKELHDNINQILATVKMFLDIAKNDDNMRLDLVQRSHEHVTHAVEEIRKLSKSLAAPTLEDVGLFEALQELVDEVNLTKKLKLILDFENYRKSKISPRLELMLYRIVQEQVNNIIKYAKAGEASVALRIHEEKVFLTIADNGVGFDTSKKAKGIGLKNISSRVEFYSGDLKIISAPGKGCTLEISIPL